MNGSSFHEKDVYCVYYNTIPKESQNNWKMMMKYEIKAC